ncbi:hypothetical protein OIV83_002161 [Microbotryomycetes sp. JL201]|nr:hypothetical protein OIV83_002161 [Microbotryomycetes sp. JL201]
MKLSLALAASVATLSASTIAAPQKPSSSSAQKCKEFKLEKFQVGDKSGQDVELFQQTWVPANTFLNLTSGSGSLLSSSMPAFCRLQLTIHTNRDTGNYANMEVWLPENKAWNGRVLGVGQGGMSGGIQFGAIGPDGLARGFSAFSTDTGHNSTSVQGRWAYNNPEALIDSGYRAIHFAAVAAKSITAKYFGKKADYSYFIGCSNAGRQGLVEAQRFPDDFDGILAGAPASPLSRMLPWELRQNLLFKPVGSPQWISKELWKSIHDEVLKQCDELDGVKDGVVTDPFLCQFRPESMACTAKSDKSKCLNTAQIDALHLAYSDYRLESVGGDQWIWSGMNWGGELLAPTGLFGELPFLPTIEYFRYWYLNNTEFNYETDFSSDLIPGSIKTNPGQSDADNVDMTAYAKSGGKLLVYHGLEDQIFSAGNSIHYHAKVDAFNQQQGVNTDDFYKLMLVPGNAHCRAGEGIHAFGGHSQRNTGFFPSKDDEKHDALRLLMAWTEKGKKPTELIGTRYNNATNGSGGVKYERKLCMVSIATEYPALLVKTLRPFLLQYPAKAIYVGGDKSKASSFKCQTTFTVSK